MRGLQLTARTAYLGAALLAIACLTTTTKSARAAASRSDQLLAPASTCPAGANATPAAQLVTMACLVNYARAHAGVSRLSESTTLDRAAALKLDEDIRCGAFSHTPCGQPFDRVFSAAGYSPGGSYSVGENLGGGQGALGSPGQIMQAWLASPEHRQNLLSTGWTSFGLAVRPGAFLGKGVALWANEFAGP